MYALPLVLEDQVVLVPPSHQLPTTKKKKETQSKK